MSKVNRIKPREGFYGVSDGDVLQRAIAVQTSLAGNPHYPNPPVDLETLKAASDRFSALAVEALDGSKKVVAEKNKQREAVIKMLRLLGRFVEVTCKEDMAILQSSGFEPASRAKTVPLPLSEKIRKIEHGANSGQIVVWLTALAEAGSYEFRHAPAGNGGTPTQWTTEALVQVKAPITLEDLTPGTTYVFQARALTKDGYTDWSDPVQFMCT